MLEAYLICTIIILTLAVTALLSFVSFYAAGSCYKKQQTARAIGYGIIGIVMLGMFINIVTTLILYC
jgi:hypothetical protein